jgi:hypothetical protein
LIDTFAQANVCSEQTESQSFASRQTWLRRPLSDHVSVA